MAAYNARHQYTPVALLPQGVPPQPYDITTSIPQPPSLGLLSVKKRLSWRDVIALLIQVTSLTASIVVVASKPAARELGQINQLVVIGILLAVMGQTFQGRLSGLLLCIEVKSGARLQNIDAILRNDALFGGISRRTQLVLLVIYGVPLALSASYKQFVGGRITYVPHSYEPLSFGLVGAPGTQGLGAGLGLMVNTSLPFFMKPDTNMAYGYNLYSFANKTTYFLDGPLPGSVSRIQQSLQSGGVFRFDARVAGMVSYDSSIPQEMRSLNSSSDFEQYDSAYTSFNTPLYPAIFSFIVQAQNYSDLYVSTWYEDEKARKPFGANLRHIKTERRWCNGTWSVSKTDVSLVKAACEADTDINQGLVQNNFAGLQGFIQQIAEFVNIPVHSGNDNIRRIDLNTPAVGAALWARVTSLNGLAEGVVANNRTDYNTSMILYSRQLSGMSISTPALRRHWALFFILALYPIATLIVVATRATVDFSTAVDQNFGLMALLAGSSPQNLIWLRGASLSGTAKKLVLIWCVVEHFLDAEGACGRIRFEVGLFG